MSVEEIVEMYEKHTETIFPSLWQLGRLSSYWPFLVLLVALLGSVWWTLRPHILACVFGWLSEHRYYVLVLVLVSVSIAALAARFWPSQPLLFPYSQDGLEKVLQEMFGNHSLYSVRGKERSIAAAVARRQNPPDRSELEIFDTSKYVEICVNLIPNHPCELIPDSQTENESDGLSTVDNWERRNSPSLVEVLKASACAPVYFEAPTSIQNVDYIDGGVGGNCPLALAIPQMKAIMPSKKILKTVISISPPRVTDTKGKKSFSNWISWLTNLLVDGHRVYQDMVSANPETVFHRLSPQSEKTKAFEMDSWDIRGMKESMR